MFTITRHALKPLQNLEFDLYHESGNLLIPKGENLRSEHMEAMERAGIEKLYAVSNRDELFEFKRTIVNTELKLSELVVGDSTIDPVYDVDSRLLLQANSEITQGIKDSLARRGFTSVYVKRNAEDRNVQQARNFSFYLTELLNPVALDPTELKISEARFINPETELSIEKLDRTNRALLEEQPAGAGLDAILKNHGSTYMRDDKVKKLFISVYKEAVRNTEKLFNLLKADEKVDADEVGHITRKVIQALISDRDLLNNFINSSSSADYLVQHTLHVTLISINIATALKFNKEQVFEVAYGAFLADIGMLKIPKELLEKTTELNVQEKLIIQQHPTFALEFLQKFNGIPLTVPYVAYQSHERMDGSGYPMQRPGEQTHTYARIVAVADTYDALIKKRAFRPALHPYHAMEQIVRLGAANKLDVNIVRGLLTFFSLFPVGCWVKLNNRKIGKVVGITPGKIDKPLLHLYEPEHKGNPAELRLDLAEVPGLRVVEVVAPPEDMADLMTGF